MLRRLAVAALAICCALVVLGQQVARAGLAVGTDPERRVALVIGNSAYARAPLRNPRNDAQAVAATLRDLGFDVVDGYDLDREDTTALLRLFERRLEGAGVGVFFYAGRGHEVDGRNRLLSVDNPMRDAGDLAGDLALDEVKARLEAQPRVSLLFVDACRDDPFPGQPARVDGTARAGSAPVARGLAPVRAGAGTLIAFSTAPGENAADGEGEHSPYTAALLRHMRTPGLEVETLLRQVRKEVLKETKGRQNPWESSSLQEAFYFSALEQVGESQATVDPVGRPARTVSREAALEDGGPDRPGTGRAVAVWGAPEVRAAPGLATAGAERRVALVVGNGAYAQVATLPNPRNDATAMAALLGRVGFEPVVLRTDLAKSELERELQSFARTAASADVALVYFAGHGLGIGLGGRAGDVTASNWLVPVDARLEEDIDVAFEAVQLDRVLEAVSGARRLRLVLLDACRDNPFARQMRRRDATRGVTRGLAAVEPPAGTVVVFAARDGTTAVDGLEDQPHSPFTSALLETIPVRGQELDKLIRVVRDKVATATDGRQEPFQYASRGGSDDFYFVPDLATAGRNR